MNYLSSSKISFIGNDGLLIPASRAVASEYKKLFVFFSSLFWSRSLGKPNSSAVLARYKLSPIMLLHKMGVLDRCTVVGGVCLDNDDLRKTVRR